MAIGAIRRMRANAIRMACLAALLAAPGARARRAARRRSGNDVRQPWGDRAVSSGGQTEGGRRRQRPARAFAPRGAGDGGVLSGIRIGRVVQRFSSAEDARRDRREALRRDCGDTEAGGRRRAPRSAVGRADRQYSRGDGGAHEGRRRALAKRHPRGGRETGMIAHLCAVSWGMRAENEKARKAASGPDVAGCSPRRILPARRYCGKPVALNFSRLPSGIWASFVTRAAFLTAWPVETAATTKSSGKPVAPNFSRLPSITWVSTSATRAAFISTVPAAWLEETLATATRMGFDAAPPVESAKRAEEKNSKVPARTIAARMIESTICCRFIKTVGLSRYASLA